MRPTTTRRTVATALAAALTVAAGASAAHAAPQADLKVDGVTDSGTFTQQVNFAGQVLLPIKHGTPGTISPRLTAAGSTPAAGTTISTYGWDLSGGSQFGFIGANPYQYMLPGAFGQDRVAAVQVKDSTGATSIARLRFRQVYLPEAVLTAPAVAEVGKPVVFDASGSKAWLDSGQAGELQSFEWDEDDNGTYERTTNANTPRIAHTFTKAGTQCIKVRAFDQNSVRTPTGRDCTRVQTPPEATFTSTPKPAAAGQELTLDATDSKDDTSIVNYEWDLDGDGTFEKNAAASKTTKVTFPKNGTFTVGLRVTDSDGSTGVDTEKIQVGPLPSAATAPGKTTGTTTASTTAAARSALTLGRVTLSRSRFAATSAAGRVAGRRGARLGVTVSEASTLTLRFDRVLKGRRTAGGACSATARRGRSCTRVRLAGSTRIAVPAGARSVVLTGRAAGAALPRGSYRVTVSARTSDGRTATAAAKAITIVRG